MESIILSPPEIESNNGEIESIIIKGQVNNNSIREVSVTISRGAQSERITDVFTVGNDRKFVALFSDIDFQKKGIQCGDSFECMAFSTSDDEQNGRISGVINCNSDSDNFDLTEIRNNSEPTYKCKSSDTKYICDTPRADPVVHKLRFTQYGIFKKYEFPSDPDRIISLPIGSYDIINSVAPKGDTPNSFDVDISLLFYYEQRWHYDQVVIGDLASTMALGPSEQVTLSIKNTDSRKYSRKEEAGEETVNKKSYEVGEKDIFSVASKVAESEGQSMKAGIGVQAGPVNLSGGVSAQSSIQTSTASTMQSIANSTQKAANELKITQKLEVTEESEITSVQGSTRILRNPFTDRPLWLKIFEQSKRYSVSTVLSDWQHVLRIHINKFPFNDSFVYENLNFLEENLIDKSLIKLLQEHFDPLNRDANLRFKSLKQKEELSTLAELALHYLYDYPPNIFNMPESPINRGNYPEEWTNDPKVGMDSSNAYSLIRDARTKGWGKVVTTLTVYYKLYQALNDENERRNQNINAEIFSSKLSDDFIVNMVLSMEDTLKPEWEKENTEWAAIFDNDDLTEVLRRLSGFLSIVGGLVRPKVKKSQSVDNEPDLLSESIVEQVLQHINSFKAHYSKKYINYLWTMGLRVEFEHMIEKFIKISKTKVDEKNNKVDYYNKLDTSKLFVDDGIIVIPFLNDLDDTKPEQELIGTESIEPVCVDLPCEGAYIVSQSGLCDELLITQSSPSRASASISIENQ